MSAGRNKREGTWSSLAAAGTAREQAHVCTAKGWANMVSSGGGSSSKARSVGSASPPCHTTTTLCSRPLTLNVVLHHDGQVLAELQHHLRTTRNVWGGGGQAGLELWCSTAS